MREDKENKILSLFYRIMVFFMVLVFSDVQNCFVTAETSSRYHRNLYTTNEDRLDSITTYCQSEPSAITASDKSQNTVFMSTISSYLTANSTKLAISIANKDISGLISEIELNGFGSMIYVGAFLIGLFILVIIWPFLLCCCFCRDSCPPKQCRDEHQTTYSQMELNWPMIFLLIACLLIVSSSIFALAKSDRFFTDFNCLVARMNDDLLNGNVTDDKQYFFAGVKTIRTQLTTVLSPEIANIKTQISKLKDGTGTTMNNSISYANTALNSILNCPNNVGNGSLSLSYNYPFQSTSNIALLPSQLSLKMGNVGLKNTLIGQLYQSVLNIANNLTNISSTAAMLQSHLTPGDMGAQITAADGVLSKIQGSIQSIQSSMENLLEFLNLLDIFSTKYVKVIYCMSLSVSFAIILSAIFLRICKMLKCRYFLYLLCFLTFFVCILVFVLAILLAFLAPTLFYTCDFFNSAFDSPAQFSGMASALGFTEMITISNYYQECFGGTNMFFDKINPTLSTYLDRLLSSTITEVYYNFPQISSNLTSQLTVIESAINDYGLGHIPDFDVNTVEGRNEINFFKSVANKSYFSTLCPSLLFTTFYTDTWVPGVSTAYQNYVSCNGKTIVDSSICTNGLVNPPCPTSHCLDTFSILSWYYRNNLVINLLANSNIRYGVCPLFTTFMTNFLNRYVTPINDKIGNTIQDSANTNKFAGRFVTNVKTSVNNLATFLVSNVKPLYEQTYGNLSMNNLNSIFHQQTGLLSGLDCRLLRQNINKVKDSLCITAFNQIYFMLVILGVMSFSLLVALCCTLCFTIRMSSYLQNTTTKVHPLSIVHVKLNESSESIKSIP